MIPLERIRTVEAISAKFRGDQKKQADKTLMLARRDMLNGTIKSIDFKSTFWKTAKDQLKKESYGKCAYCEANAEVVAHGDVEHYRPKSIYWWLAYTYDNYLFACQICNQVYKSDNFPFGGEMFPAPALATCTTEQQIEQLIGHISPDPVDVGNDRFDKYLNSHKNEKAFLLNPYFDDPAKIVAYQVDDIKQEVIVIAAKPSDYIFIQTMEECFGINRIELKNSRYSIYSKFKILKRVLPAISDVTLKEDVKHQIEEMKANHFPFAGMNRYFDSQL